MPVSDCRPRGTPARIFGRVAEPSGSGCGLADALPSGRGVRTVSPPNRAELPMTAPAQRIEPRTLKGFRDYLPDTMNVRERLIESGGWFGIHGTGL